MRPTPPHKQRSKHRGKHRSKIGLKKSAARKPSRIDRTPFEVTVEDIGHKGDGIAFHEGEMVFVPSSLVGEVIEVVPITKTAAGIIAEIGRIITPSDARKDPDCYVAAQCGGCTFQHMAHDVYHNWKATMLRTQLAPLNLDDDLWQDSFNAEYGGRRRARLAYRHIAAGVVCGFRARKSHQIIVPKGCTILHPELISARGILSKEILSKLATGSQGEVVITLVDQGFDIAIYPDTPPSHKEVSSLIAAAADCALARPALERLALARLTLAEKDGLMTSIFTARTPSLNWPIDNAKSFTLLPAPGAFLQADAGAESVMQADVMANIGGAKKVLDLFCGSGALSLPLLHGPVPPTLIHGYDSGGDALAAMLASAKAAGFRHNVKTTPRNLAKDPLSKDELDGYDAVIVDPPRSGAATQMPALANSDIPKIMMVSCNPASFVRDAAVLIKTGYQCRSIRMLDQFMLTSHVEITALFTRN